MAEAALELRAILDAAEQAAAAEDFVSAERHLRQAAELQEALLGPGHHDLANTLNNLGIVCEHVGKSADAEACYRRAYRIASTALPPDHALVQTSGQNLRDFCTAMGKAFELQEPQPQELDTFASESSASKAAASAPQPAPKPQPVPIAAPVTSAPAPAPVTPAPVTPAPVKPTPIAPPAMAAAKPPAPVAPARPPRPTGVRAPEPPVRLPTAVMRTASPVSPPSSRPTAAIVVIGAVLLLAFAVWWFGFRGPVAPREQAAAPVTDVAPEAPAPAPIEQPPIAAAPAPEAVARPRSTVAPEKPAPVAASGASKDAPPPPRAAASGGLSVAEAKLCRPLSTSNWACTAATSPTAPGVFFFYTRVRSPRDTTVQHRWLMNGRLLRSVSLRIGANPGAGYRTYSRNTVTAERRGDWTIELRDAGGALLHEERFTVR